MVSFSGRIVFKIPGRETILVKRCQFCGRFFVPDYRVGERQKSCGRKECRRARKQLAQRRWCAQNPGYFQGRYAYVKEWRQKRLALTPSPKVNLKPGIPEMIQDKSFSSKPYLRLVLLIPGEKEGLIQDKIILKRQSRCTFAAYG